MTYEPTVNEFVRVAKKILKGKSIKILVEIGARDCSETLRFRELLPDTFIYTFECNPETLPLCREVVKKCRNINLIEKAVTTSDGLIKFYPIDKEKTVTAWLDGNPGASSLLKASGKYPIEKYVQKEIEVEAVTLKTFMHDNNIDCIDLLWMDIQGGELMALQGMSDRIHDVKLIHTEVELLEIYKNQPLFRDIKKFLQDKGFLFLTFTAFSKYSADAIFVNKSLIQNNTTLLKHMLLNKLQSFKYKIIPYLKTVQKQVNSALKLLIFDRRTWYMIVLKHSQALLKFNGCCSSSICIDVIITVIEKDFDVLPYTIQSVRSNVRHPIGQIFVIAPETEKIKLLCREEKCTYLNEETILPINKKDIDYFVKGVDRSGWLMQQLIKLNGDKICSQEYFLAIDADTVLIQPHTFLTKNKTIFLCSDEYHLPYFETYHKLLGERTTFPVSFVSHYMLFHKPKLHSLKKAIEQRNNTLWFNAIISCISKTETSSFSEYETYGNFLRSNFSTSVKLKYWFNISMSRKKINEISRLKKDLCHKYRAISFHSYKQ